jgi:hypothetical protein
MSLRYPVAVSGLAAVFRVEGVAAEGISSTGVPLGTISHGPAARGPAAWLPLHAASHSIEAASSAGIDGLFKPRSLLDRIGPNRRQSGPRGRHARASALRIPRNFYDADDVGRLRTCGSLTPMLVNISNDPVDHHRTSRPLVGQTLKSPAKEPGLLLMAVGLVAYGICLNSLAHRQIEAGVTAALISLVAAATGGIWLCREARRVRKLENDYNAKKVVELVQASAAEKVVELTEREPAYN